MPVTRRKLLLLAAGLGGATTARALFGPFVAPAFAAPSGDAPTSSGAPPSDAVPASFPTQEPDVVREVVGASHSKLDRVRELVISRPTLADATWDWGFGDWESALGAASHVGRRDIAEFLLSNGATPTMFSAAMLGQLEVVQAFVAASPGVQRTLGPHGISLLRHAEAGGDPAKPVLEYLTSLGDADPAPPLIELAPADLARYVGRYIFGDGADDQLAVSVDDRGRLRLARGSRSHRLLFALGEHEFFPSGAPNVRIQFTMNGERAVSLAVHDPEVVLVARLGA